MFLLPLFITLNLNLATFSLSLVLQDQDRLTLSVIDEKQFNGEPGYYFGLASIPLSQNQYIFEATPLKKAYFVIGGEKIHVGHTMTVKETKGFTYYFSGDKYNARLAIKEESQIDRNITDYRGTLEIQHGAEKRKFKVHGRRYQ